MNKLPSNLRYDRSILMSTVQSYFDPMNSTQYFCYSILLTCSRIIRSVRNTRGIFSSSTVLNDNKDDGDQKKDHVEAEKTDPVTQKKETEKKLQDLLLMMSKVPPI